MSGSLNKVFLIGRLGQTPEIRTTASGQEVVNFSLATDESYAGQDGQKVERTEWHRIVAWGKHAEFVFNYLAKGALVCIEGKLETHKWKDQQGGDTVYDGNQGESCNRFGSCSNDRRAKYSTPIKIR